jgi:2-polyprenyl-6-methoxyphenol hydroxylase-like FAD-dependent oxidoreductase
MSRSAGRNSEYREKLISWHADHTFTVTISGGSVAGLCNAIALRKIGATVTVHERVPGPMMDRGAGIVVQSELMRLLEENGAGPLPFTSCRGRRYLNPDGGDGVLQEMPQEFTSWEAIHAALRAAVPDECYRAGSEVVTVSQTDTRVSATLGDGSMVESDLFLAADGSGSAIRRKMLSDIEAAYEASILARALKSARANVDVALQSTERLQLEYGNALYQYGLALGNRWSRERSTD